MSVAITDQLIAQLLREPKHLRRSDFNKLAPGTLNARGHRQGTLDITSKTGRKYRIIVRENKKLPNNFSVILSTKFGKKTIRLLRCQGWHGEHPNHIEKKSGIGIALIPKDTCHVHRFTERYYNENPEEDGHDGYAEPTSEYTNWKQALEFLAEIANFQFTDDSGNGMRPLFNTKL